MKTQKYYTHHGLLRKFNIILNIIPIQSILGGF